MNRRIEVSGDRSDRTSPLQRTTVRLSVYLFLRLHKFWAIRTRSGDYYELYKNLARVRIWGSGANLHHPTFNRSKVSC